MRIVCPLCGERDSREFSYKGAALALAYPSEEAGFEAWDDYLHNRDNPAGPTRELWYHGSGCTSWLVVTRNTTTHEILSVELAEDAPESRQEASA